MGGRPRAAVSRVSRGRARATIAAAVHRRCRTGIRLVNEPRTVPAVLRWILTSPWEAVGRRWNYKAAVLSAVVRSLLFFCVNIGAGLAAANQALTTELVFRFATAGFYGALTAAFRNAEPRATATFTAIVVLPVASHSLEFVVHWLRGTAMLAPSVAISVVFSVVSTAFNLFAMREGRLLVGANGRPVLDDLQAMPRLIARFVLAITRSHQRVCP